MSKTTPGQLGRSMIILAKGISFMGHFHFEISQVWIYLFKVRSYIGKWTATPADLTTFAPQRLVTFL